jgi:hypothetical protein
MRCRIVATEWALSRRRGPELPDTFTNIHPAFFTKKNPIPSKVNIPLNLDTNNIKIYLTVEHEWLEKTNRLTLFTVIVS